MDFKLILLIIFLVSISINSFSIVEVYERRVVPFAIRVNCSSLFNPTFSFVKNQKGIQRSLSKNDPTLRPEQIISENSYKIEISHGLETVRKVYEEIFRRMKWPESKIQEQLNKFTIEDNIHFNNQNPNVHIIYFISRRDQTPVGVLRAILVKENTQGKLLIESQLNLSNRNKVEIGRLFNEAGRYSQIVNREILQVAAKSFHNYFDGNNYEIFGLTNNSRARLYNSAGFSYEILTNTNDPINNYLVRQSGSSFYNRYVGHIEDAYKSAFISDTDRPQSAIDKLIEFENKPGMKDYIPNLVAQATIQAYMGNYEKALFISDHLKSIGTAEVNLDYNSLWSSRLKYDPFWERVGDSNTALEIVDKYLISNPLEIKIYSERTALFAIYKLKIYLSIERFDLAEKLLTDYKLILTEAVHEKRFLFNIIIHNQFLKTKRYLNLNLDTKPVLNFYRRILDLGTSQDRVAISALSPQLYNQLSLIFRQSGNISESDHFSKLGHWLSQKLNELDIPEIDSNINN